MTGSLAVAVEPENADARVADAVRAGGGRLVAPGAAEALIWLAHDPERLKEILREGPGIRWVQLPSAGVERYASLLDDGRLWTGAKGVYAAPVAEHALALALAGLHHLPRLARAHGWNREVECLDLYGGRVTVAGGGGIAQALLRLLIPFNAEVTVVRRHPAQMEGADRVLPSEELDKALPDADVVVLALAMTPETRGMIGAARLRAMKEDAWLVNVARGGLIDTESLVLALRAGWIGGAALDVSDPEPLPPDSPLWDLDNCLITPHCANPPGVADRLLADLIRENVRRRIEGEPLQGVIDPNLGY